MADLFDIKNIQKAKDIVRDVALVTPLQHNERLSEQYEANVYFKREDLQPIRSFKLRGAYHKIYKLSDAERKLGIVCASAGNHAQGVALACNKLGIKGTIFMPVPTPKQKLNQVRMFGGENIETRLVGDTFDDAYAAAQSFKDKSKSIFIHPFDDKDVVIGQATLALELLEQSQAPIDYILVPIGGGGLISGVLHVFKTLSPNTKVIGIEPEGAPAMHQSLERGKNTELNSIDPFVDGAAVRKVGDDAYDLCDNYLDKLVLVSEGKICQSILKLYNREAIVVEPAGAMSTASLKMIGEEIKGKNVVCLICGGNNDITRMAEIKERALLEAKLLHYFIVRFPQRAGALKEFVADVLGPKDDITFFEYSKKNNRSNGPAVVGIELKNPDDLNPLVKRMKSKGFYGDYINNKPDLFQFLI
ncbi:MAG: threonine ammonia-lyase IlvA [Flavobacteriales bacterium]|nr:threonine ammonia-lyase IlvA [Flavobacteriales bacterium]